MATTARPATRTTATAPPRPPRPRRRNEDEPADTTTTTEAEDDEDDRDEAIGDFGDTIEDELGDVPTEEPMYSDYVEVTDDSGFLTVDVPVEWIDVDGSPGLFGPNVLASTDVQRVARPPTTSPASEFEATDIQTGQTNDEILTAISPVAGPDHGLHLARPPALRATRPTSASPRCSTTAPAPRPTSCGWPSRRRTTRFHGVVGVQIFSTADVDALEHALATFFVDA